EVYQVELATGKILKRFQTGQLFTLSVRFSSDGKLLAIGGGDEKSNTGRCTVEIWDVATEKRVVTCRGHNHSIRRLAFSPDATMLYSSGSNDGVRAWDVTTGKEQFRLYDGEKTSVVGLELLPDGKTLLTLPAKEGSAVHFWDAVTGKRIVSP